MAQAKQFRSHGGVRGANLSRGSVLFEGPFGRIFRALPPADFGPDDQSSLTALGKLADKMTAVADPADPKDGQTMRRAVFRPPTPTSASSSITI